MINITTNVYDTRLWGLVGMMDVKDISSWVHQSGIVMQLTHPSLPNMELNVSDENRNLVTPDGDLETKIDEKI